MKNKIGFVVGGGLLLVGVLLCELIPMGYVIWVTVLRDYKPTDGPADISGLPYILGALALIAAVFFFSRNDGARPDLPAQIIHLGHDREDCDTVILKMAGKAEQRSFGRQTGAKIVLVRPEGFDPQKLDYDAQLNYKWLAEHPENGITIK